MNERRVCVYPAGIGRVHARGRRALYIDAEELVAYDRRLLDAAETQALRVASPGLP